MITVGNALDALANIDKSKYILSSYGYDSYGNEKQLSHDAYVQLSIGTETTGTSYYAEEVAVLEVTLAQRKLHNGSFDLTFYDTEASNKFLENLLSL